MRMAFQKGCTVSYFLNLREIISESSPVYIYIFDVKCIHTVWQPRFPKKKNKNKNQVFLKLKTIFLSTNRDTYAKLLMKMFNENKGPVRFDFCLNFAFISCYLQTKTFTWKRDCVIFSKPQHAMTFTETILESNCKILQNL